MSISIKTHKMLWGRAACRCSEPNCRIELYEDETETDDATLIGENCHIVAESDDGPRADPTMPIERRNSYGNLILLCRIHHKIIDSQPKKYSSEYLAKMKKAHEDWVQSQLSFDEKKQKDDEYYSGMIDEWQRLAHLDEWTSWSSSLLSHGQPSIWKEVDDDLFKLRKWLLNRIWPGRYPKLESALNNFRLVLQDFQEKFREYAEPFGGDELMTRKFYHIQEWNEEKYNRLARQYDFHVDLVEDLMLELTRAANLVCDQVREFVIPSYRLSEGRLSVESGPNFDFKWQRSVVQYDAEERKKDQPYPGLASFYTERADRDLHYGEGPPIA